MRVPFPLLALLAATTTLLGEADAYHGQIPATCLRPQPLCRSPLAELVSLPQRSSPIAVIAPPIDPVVFKWPIMVTGAWLVMYYNYMTLGPTAGIAGSDEGHKLCCDRIFGNLHEQSVPFLVTTWLHAVFVSPVDAGILGASWLMFRALYAPYVSFCQSRKAYTRAGNTARATLA